MLDNVCMFLFMLDCPILVIVSTKIHNFRIDDVIEISKVSDAFGSHQQSSRGLSDKKSSDFAQLGESLIVGLVTSCSICQYSL